MKRYVGIKDCLKNKMYTSVWARAGHPAQEYNTQWWIRALQFVIIPQWRMVNFISHMETLSQRHACTEDPYNIPTQVKKNKNKNKKQLPALFYIKREIRLVSKIKTQFQPQFPHRVQHMWFKIKGVINPGPQLFVTFDQLKFIYFCTSFFPWWRVGNFCPCECHSWS